MGKMRKLITKFFLATYQILLKICTVSKASLVYWEIQRVSGKFC